MTVRYGLGAANNLSDVEDNVASLISLGVNPQDLYILQRAGASGVSSTDYVNLSGLSYLLEPQVVDVLNRATTLVNNYSPYVANSGDRNVGSLYAPTVNSDRA